MAQSHVIPSTSFLPVPTLPSHWYRGHVDNFLREGSLHFHERLQRECGDVASFRLGRWRIYQVTHPDDVERVLRGSNRAFRKGYGWTSTRQMIGEGVLSVEPDKWLPQRRALQPAFLRRYHEQFASTFSSTISQSIPHFDEIARLKEPVSVLNEMARLTLINTNLTLFGKDVSNEEELPEHIAEVLDYVNGYYGYPFYKRLIGPYIKRTKHARFRRSRNELWAFADGMVQDRLRQHERGEEIPDDVLSLLLFDEDRKTLREHPLRHVRDEISTLLFAAHETTALTLCWTWWLLSQNPEVEVKLHQELERVLGGRAPTFEDLPNLPYGRMVIEESLRLRPPIWQIARESTQDEIFSGHRVSQGNSVLAVPWITHRHPDFWENPELFDPDRFLPERRALQHPYAYVPFGGGPRLCMGRRTALVEVQLAISTIAQRFTLRPAANYKAEPLPLITLRPSQGMPMTLHPRS